MRKLAVCVNFMNDAYRRRIEAAARPLGFGVDFYGTQEELAPHIRDYEVIYGHPDPALLRQTAALRWLCSDTAGVDKYLDDAVWPQPDCLLSNSSGAYGPTIAEHILMVLLMLLRRMPEYGEIVRRRSWSNQLPIRSIRDNQVTILGTGDIGVNVAQRMRGMNIGSVTGLSRSGKAKGPADLFDQVLPISKLDEVLPQTKILVMALPDTPETRGILSRERIALLPSDAIVINVGRGPAVDQDALMEALNGKKIAGAALDVMVPEPLPQEHPLWETKNLILTPHVSGNMTLGYTCDRNVDLFCQDLLNYAAGRPLEHLVDRRRGY